MRVFDPATDPGWDERIRAHPDASVFHTAAWARVLNRTYGFSSCFFAETEGEQLRFVLPLMEVRSVLTGRRGVSLPFTDFCEPLGAAGVPGEQLLALLVERGRRQGWRYFELRGGAGLFGSHEPSVTVLGHTLDLASPEEEQFARLRESTRRNIRKARREGVTVAIGTSEGMVGDFYRLNCLTRREHGRPPQPPAFFRNLREHLLDKGLGCVALARQHDRVVGGAVYLGFGGNALYKYGASDPHFLASRPNDLLMWEAIRWHRDHGFRQLSFGRTELQHEGLRRYKTGWGAAEEAKPYYRYDFAAAGFGPIPSRAGSAASTVFRRLPLGVSRLIGSVLYRHVA